MLVVRIEEFDKKKSRIILENNESYVLYKSEGSGRTEPSDPLSGPAGGQCGFPLYPPAYSAGGPAVRAVPR